MAMAKVSLRGYRQTVGRDSCGLLKPSGDEITSTRQHSRLILRKKDPKKEVSDQKLQS
jgi:hypothetical protein